MYYCFGYSGTKEKINCALGFFISSMQSVRAVICRYFIVQMMMGCLTPLLHGFPFFFFFWVNYMTRIVNFEIVLKSILASYSGSFLYHFAH